MQKYICNSGKKAIKETEYDGFYALKVCDNSMINARIGKGDIVIFHSQSTVENGAIAVLVIDCCLILKRVYYSDNGEIVLMSDNPDFESLIYNNDEFKKIHVLGRVVGRYTDYEGDKDDSI